MAHTLPFFCVIAVPYWKHHCLVTTIRFRRLKNGEFPQLDGGDHRRCFLGPFVKERAQKRFISGLLRSRVQCSAPPGGAFAMDGTNTINARNSFYPS